MSNFLKMFRSKKTTEKDNFNTGHDDEKAKHRSKESYGSGSSRRDKRISRIRSIDDSLLRPTAAYHTVTQSRQYKTSRSCVGRDEYDKYDRFRHSIDFHNRGSMRCGKRSHVENDRLHDRVSMFTKYDSEILDSDDSYDSQNGSGTNNDDTVQALETKLDALLYRLRREEERKNSYKQKLMSERIVRQHVESKFVEDIQRLTQLVEMLKNEQKSYRNRISALEKQLKHTGPKLMTDSFKGPSLFCSPPSTSNGPSSVLAMNELACSATSGSTVPLPSTLHCSTINEGSVDEVRNFRINEVTSSVEAERRTISGSSFSTRENDCSATLEETLRAIDRATAATTTSSHGFGDKVATSVIRRSSSDTKLGQRDIMLKSTNI
ncbi:Uncharacterized protein BM_BM11082 [Brugia malayi]|uniref:Bm11082 n=3 Tax=Brugia TaxID=6278 RepID=A0A4E9FCP6_BRUMA|nr:Uncharacterized protein BM_BM11082 [Brugia malayi]VDO22726.1 unnamed protein product [Brugia timori]VIO94681.1 Uncharacterized protein BM_BM11082 [Brugia malayi]